jgi:predicted  nucleic acid-binding Zn-ribbon protein
MNRLLWELQEADSRIARLKRERAKLDDGSAARSERDTLQSARDAAAVALNTVTSQRTAKEDEQKDIENKLTRSQSRLMQASSAHEVTALERDIKGLNSRRGELDEDILMLMDEVETATSKLTQIDAQLKEQAGTTAQVEQHFTIESKRLERELVDAVKQRDAIAAQLEPPSLAKYKDYFSRFHGIAVAHLDKGNCSACGMAITPFNLKEAKTDTWPSCESCGRLLFIE